MSDPILPAGTHPQIQQAISDLAKPKTAAVLSVAPQANQVPEGGQLYAIVAGTMYQYTKFQGKLYRVAMTAV